MKKTIIALSVATTLAAPAALADIYQTIQCPQVFKCTDYPNQCTPMPGYSWVMAPISGVRSPTVTSVLTSVQIMTPNYNSGFGIISENTAACHYSYNGVKFDLIATINYPTWFPDFQSNTGWDPNGWIKNQVVPQNITCNTNNGQNKCQITTMAAEKQLGINPT